MNSLLAPVPFHDQDGIVAYHGDCFTVMPYLHQPVAMVLADLPFGTTRQDWDRPLDNKLLWHQYHALCGERTPIVLFGTGLFSASVMLSNPDEYAYTLIWDKDAVSGHLNAKRQPLRAHEDMLVFYRGQPTYHPQMVFTGRKSHSRGKTVERTVNHYGAFGNTEVVEQDGYQYPRSIVTFKRPKLPKGMGHPNQKPVDLMRWLIRTFTNPGDLVLDNVMGSGTTLIAARAEGRRAVGIEARDDYAEMAAGRLASSSEGDRW